MRLDARAFPEPMRYASRMPHLPALDPAASHAPRETAPGPGFGIYVHWPFCAQKCPYCDFNSHVRHGGVDEARYLRAFIAELENTRALTGPQRVASIFIGGGTPSLMAPATTAGILDAIARLWIVDPGAEITIEANPGSVEAGRFRGYRTAGVNRVSLGVQSLSDVELQKLGRIHTVAEAKAAVAIARATFERVSFDLIYARPKQTPAGWKEELTEALAMAEGHLSLYQLTIEPETAFAKLHAAGKLIVPGADDALALYEITQEMTGIAGLPAYEISNHARPGEQSRHNLLYWRYGTYAGVGPGAHGRLPVGGERLASETLRQPEAWLAQVERDGHGRNTLEPLTRDEQADELLLMGLRLGEGIDLTRLANVGHVAPSKETIAGLERLGLIELFADNRRLRASGPGRFVLNALVAELSKSFVPAAPTGISA